MSEKARQIKLYDWILQEFTVAARASLVAALKPYLVPLAPSKARVLDLCCGTGPFAFLFEEMGARVTAIDIAPSMIKKAREEAARRKSGVEFIEADVFTYNLGAQSYDLAVLLGNTLSDFSITSFISLKEKVRQALKPGGHFALHYRDGLAQFIHEHGHDERTQQEAPDKITVRFTKYLPEESAYIETYLNHMTGESYDYASYIYTSALVKLAIGQGFTLTKSESVGDNSFLDIFKRL